MEFIQQLGGLSYLGVFGVTLLANVFIPFPEEVTLISLGYLAGTGVFHLAFIIPISMVGLFISDFMIYSFAKRGAKITQKFYERFFLARFSFLNNLEGDRLERVIIFSRFLVHLRFLAPFLAGYYRLPFKTFLRHEAVALSVYTTITVGAGFFLRNRIEKVFSGISVVQNIVLAVVFFTAGVFFFRWLKQYVMKKITLKF